jgi:hypothetical protein
MTNLLNFRMADHTPTIPPTPFPPDFQEFLRYRQRDCHLTPGARPRSSSKKVREQHYFVVGYLPSNGTRRRRSSNQFRITCSSPESVMVAAGFSIRNRRPSGATS